MIVAHKASIAKPLQTTIRAQIIAKALARLTFASYQPGLAWVSHWRPPCLRILCTVAVGNDILHGRLSRLECTLKGRSKILRSLDIPCAPSAAKARSQRLFLPTDQSILG